MARFLVNTATAKKRRETYGGYHTKNVYKWVDPYPEVHGTLPEKMVYAELSRLGIPFYFLNDIRFQIPDIEFDKEYQADFVIPAIKLIIEVQGAFWHTKDKTIESDAFKFAIYETGGYRVLAWWDFDILARLQDLFASEPSLLALARPTQTNSTELTPLKRTKVDTSKGIRTLNQRRFAAPAPKVSKRKVRKPLKGFMTYATTR